MSPQARTVVVERDVETRMRDGTILRANVWRPATGRHPVLLQRTPYGKDDSFTAHHHSGLEPLRAVDAGYVVVQQDVRGRFASDGRFEPFVNERADGSDTVAWLAEQPYSDGSVGMFGVSYVGATQMLAASSRPGALRAITPHETAFDYHTGWIYRSGAFELGFNLLWALALAQVDVARRRSAGEPVEELEERLLDLSRGVWAAYRTVPLAGGLPALEEAFPAWRSWLDRPESDGSWRDISPRGGAASPAIDVPALHIAGWHDIFLAGALDAYEELRAGAQSARARDGQRLVIGPWAHAVPHETVGDVDFGPTASQLAVDMTELHLDWFDEQLRGRVQTDRAPVRIFVMGINRWRDEDSWPPPRAADQRWYLTSGGRIGRQPPASDEAHDEFVYDPADPVPTVGGATFLPGLFVGWHAGPQDVASLDGRSDILRYQSAVLEQPMEVTGRVRLDLFASTSARDTDFTARLADVHPDGRAIGVTSGILRARYRRGMDRAEFPEQREVCEYQIDLGATSMVFAAGHRLRVDISSSDFPRFDRNPNHGGPIASATGSDWIVAVQRVFHDTRYPSALVLPVVLDSRPGDGG